MLTADQEMIKDLLYICDRACTGLAVSDAYTASKCSMQMEFGALITV